MEKFRRVFLIVADSFGVDGGLCRSILGGILVELRLADGVDAGQRYRAFVVVLRLDCLCPRGFERRACREQRGGQLVGIDGEKQLSPLDGHAVAVSLGGEVSADTGLDDRIEIAGQVADETHPVGHAVQLGAYDFHLERRHPGRLLFRAVAAGRQQCENRDEQRENFLHNGAF